MRRWLIGVHLTWTLIRTIWLVRAGGFLLLGCETGLPVRFLSIGGWFFPR